MQHKNIFLVHIPTLTKTKYLHRTRIKLVSHINFPFTNKKKFKLKEKELNESLVLTGIKPDLIGEIEKSLLSNSMQIRNNLNGMRLKTVEYSNVEWRVDVNLATRAVREIIEPEIVLKLDMKSGQDDQITSEVLKTDVVNLVHLTNSLEDALNEIKTHYVRRVMKNIV